MQDSNTTPALSYSVSPQSISASQDGGTQSVVALAVTAANAGSQAQTIQSIAYTLQVGAAAADIAQIAGGITAAVSEPASGWTITTQGTVSTDHHVTYLTFTLTPGSSSTLAVGKSILVTLQGIEVSDVVGGGLLTIGEQVASNSDETYKTLTVEKISPVLQLNYFEFLETEVVSVAPTFCWGSSAASAGVLYVGSFDDPVTTYDVAANEQTYTLPTGITQTTAFYLTVTGGGETTDPLSATVIVANPAVSWFDASAPQITSGASVTLSWQATGSACCCYLFAGDYAGTVPGSGVQVPTQASQYTATPSATTTYTLVAYDENCQVASAPLSVTVTLFTISDLTISPANPTPGQTVTVSWSAPPATSTYVTLDPWPDTAYTLLAPTASPTSFTIVPVAPLSVTLTLLGENGLQTSQTVSVPVGTGWNWAPFGANGYGVVNSMELFPQSLMPLDNGIVTVGWGDDGFDGIGSTFSSNGGVTWSAPALTSGLSDSEWPVTCCFPSATIADFSTPRYFALGLYGGTTYTSSDTINWTSNGVISPNFPNSQDYMESSANYYVARYNGLYWLVYVFVGSNTDNSVGLVVTLSSPDLKTWTEVSAQQSNDFANAACGLSALNGLVVFNNQLNMITNSGIWVSTDGDTWTQQTLSAPLSLSYSTTVNGQALDVPLMYTGYFVVNSNIFCYQAGIEFVNSEAGAAQVITLINSDYSVGQPTANAQIVPNTDIGNCFGPGLVNGVFYVIGPTGFTSSLSVGGPLTWSS